MSHHAERERAPGGTAGPGERAAPGASGPRPRRGAAAIAALLVLPLLPEPAVGQESPHPSVSFDAFGTLGVVHSTEEHADFVPTLLHPDGPGASEDVSPDPDSRLGAQVTAFLTPELTVVVQVVSEQNPDDDYVPHVEWANVRYDVTRDFSVRAGRVALPAFLVSDHREVSYANPWVRPPPTLYGLVPVFTVDGVDASYRFHSGDWTTTLGASFGRAEQDFPGDGGTTESENSLNVNAKVQRGGLTGRVAVARGELDIDAFDPFFDAFREFGPRGREIADRFEVDDTPFEFATLGAEYDPGRWFGIAEVAWADFNSVLGEAAAGHVTTGVRTGPVTPYVVYARRELVSESSAPGLSLAELPPAAAGAAAELNAALNQILRSMPVQQNLSVGGRWDIRPGVALKAQVDFVDLLDQSPGMFANVQPGFEPGGSARLFSLATTFVF